MLQWGNMNFVPSILVLTGPHLYICNVNILQLLTNVALEQHVSGPVVSTVPTKQEELPLTHFKLVLVNRGLKGHSLDARGPFG